MVQRLRLVSEIRRQSEKISQHELRIQFVRNHPRSWTLDGVIVRSEGDNNNFRYEIAPCVIMTSRRSVSEAKFLATKKIELVVAAFLRVPAKGIFIRNL